MLATLLLLAISTTSLPEFERILLPVVVYEPIPGAHGSLWQTVVTIRNASDETLTHYPPQCPLLPVPIRFCQQTQLAPGDAREIHLLTETPVFLNVNKSLADQTFVQLRVRDLSRDAESFGTEIPVVRAAEMKTGHGEILDVPNDPRFRLTLRLYADVVEQATDIVVRFVNETTGETSESRYSVLPLPDNYPTGEPIISPPLYQQIDAFDSYAELRTAERIRIEFHPDSDAVRYWAFVSITNNDSQQITTLTVH